MKYNLKKNEWLFVFMRKGKHDCDNCEYPNLANLFYLQNIATGEYKIVGSECVKYFQELDVSAMTKLLNTTNFSETLPMSVVKHARSKNIINEWEFTFLSSMHNRRRILTDNQKTCKERINQKIHSGFVKK